MTAPDWDAIRTWLQSQTERQQRAERSERFARETPPEIEPKAHAEEVVNIIQVMATILERERRRVRFVALAGGVSVTVSSVVLVYLSGLVGPIQRIVLGIGFFAGILAVYGLIATQSSSRFKRVAMTRLAQLK